MTQSNCDSTCTIVWKTLAQCSTAFSSPSHERTVCAQSVFISVVVMTTSSAQCLLINTRSMTTKDPSSSSSRQHITPSVDNVTSRKASEKRRLEESSASGHGSSSGAVSRSCSKQKDSSEVVKETVARTFSARVCAVDRESETRLEYREKTHPRNCKKTRRVRLHWEHAVLIDDIFRTCSVPCCLRSANPQRQTSRGWK